MRSIFLKLEAHTVSHHGSTTSVKHQTYLLKYIMHMPYSWLVKLKMD